MDCGGRVDGGVHGGVQQGIVFASAVRIDVVSKKCGFNWRWWLDKVPGCAIAAAVAVAATVVVVSSTAVVVVVVNCMIV